MIELERNASRLDDAEKENSKIIGREIPKDVIKSFWRKYKKASDFERIELLKTLSLFSIFLETNRPNLKVMLNEHNCEHLFFTSIKGYIDDLIDEVRK
jgi:hypothetical protein